MTALKTEAIETLTDDEAGALRVLTRCPGWGSQREVEALAKALRIIDAQAKDIKALRAEVADATALLARLRRENVRWSGTGTTQLARDVDGFFSRKVAK